MSDYETWEPEKATDEHDGWPDARIVPLVEFLREWGFVTLQSCSGHPGFDGHLMFDPASVPASWERLGMPFSIVRRTYHPEPWFELWWVPDAFADAEQKIRELALDQQGAAITPRDPACLGCMVDGQPHDSDHQPYPMVPAASQVNPPQAKNDDERCTATNAFAGRCILVYGHLYNHRWENPHD